MFTGTVCTGLALLFLLSGNVNATFNVLVHPVSSFAINGTEYGLPYPSLYGKLKYFRLDDPNGPLNDVSKLLRNRSISIMKVEEVLTSKPHWELFAATVKSPKYTLLLVIPRRQDVLHGPKLCEDAHATPFAQTDLPVCEGSKVHQKSLMELEEFVKSAKCPIGILEDGDDVKNVCKVSGGRGGLLQDEVRITSKQYEPNSLSKFSSFNILGSLKDQNLGDDVPTLLITAPLDTFNFVQTLSSTAGYNSPLVTLLELVRLFGEGFSKGQFPWKVKFLLTTGTILDFYGLKNFLKENTVDFAICLDDLSGDSLYIHKGLVDDKTEKLVKALGVQDKERDSSATEFYFSHDVFTKYKIPAVTISSVENGVPLVLRLSSFNFSFDSRVLAERVTKIAEAVTKSLTGKTKKVNVAPDDLEVLQNLLSEPRNPFEVDLDGLKSVLFIVEELEKHLDVEKLNFKASISTSTIKSPPVSKATVHLSKHALFDIVIATVVFSYIFLVWCVVRTPKNAIKEIAGLLSVFTNQKTRKE